MSSRIKEVFDFFDKEKKGEISIKDAENGLVALGADTIEIDYKNYGSTVDYDTFTSMCSENKVDIEGLHSKLIDVLNMLDSKGDGAISVDIVKNLLSQDGVGEKEIQNLIKAAPKKGSGIDINDFANELLADVGDDE